MDKLKSLIKQLDTQPDKRDSIIAEIQEWKVDEDIDDDNRPFKPYPDFNDTTFHKTLLEKYEFNKFTYDKNTVTTCVQSKSLELSNNQKFLKNYISPQTPYNGILLYHGVGVGKCFARGTQVLEHSGRWMNVEDVRLDTVLMGDDSGKRNVTCISTGHDEMYNIIPRYNGIPYIVSSQHVLCLKYLRDDGLFQDVNIPVEDYIHLPDDEKARYYGYHSPIVFFPQKYSMNASGNFALVNSPMKFYPHVRKTMLEEVIDKEGIVSVDNEYIIITFKQSTYDLFRSLGIGINIRHGLIYAYGSNLRFLNLKTLKIHPNMLRHTYFTFDVQPCGKDFFYGFEVDGNHKFIIQDYIVTHNSCSAISIAEQFHDDFDKKVLVLMPTNLKENFKKQIIDINKPAQSCTGTKYYNPEKFIGMNKDIIEKKVTKQVFKQYEFKGFVEFANQFKDFTNKREKAKYIKDTFSNRVIIIDEVHNVREGDNSAKIVPPELIDVMKYSENVKLILLSATPMFNEASEIVDIINLLLLNDNKKPIEAKTLFKDGRLTKEAKGKLTNLFKGYVSYMRGENPYTFPIRLYPTDVSTRDLVPGLDIVPCKMHKIQEEAYKVALNSEHGEIFFTRIQASNICYPGNKFGKSGFDSVFDESTSYYRDPSHEILSPKHIAKYSAKLAFIVDRIKKAKGIVFVYSNYIHDGVLPLAIALEHIGFQKLNKKNIMKNTVKPNGLHYSILSGSNQYTSDFDKDLEIIKSPANANGEKCKVILGTSVAGEGIDFKNIREIYILEPWWHMNKLEQVIGRAIRHCSHQLLPDEDRNTTVYHMACVSDNIPKNDLIDLYVYSVGMEKQKNITDVENILKSTAIDCNINKNVMYYDPKVIDKKRKMTSAQGKTSYIDVGDNPDRYQRVKCLYEPSSSSAVGLDKSTYDRYFYQNGIDKVVEDIASIYENGRVSMTFEDIVKKVGQEEIVAYALSDMLSSKHLIKNKTGYLIYRGNKYIFQPIQTDNPSISLKQRERYEKPKKTFMSLENEKETSSQTSVLTKLLESVSTLQKTIGDELSNTFEKELYDYFIDRLYTEDIMNMMKEKDVPDVIIDSLQRAHILLLDGTKKYLRDVDTDEVFALEKGEFVPATQYQLSKIQQQLDVPAAPLSSYSGFIDYSKKKGINFKVVDKTKPKSSGTICHKTATLKKELLINLIGGDVGKHSKNILCDIYELSLRKNKDKFARGIEARVAIKTS